MSKKVLICLYYYEPNISWLTIYAKNLAEWLVNKWYDVTVYCWKHEKKLKNFEIINWVKIKREFVLCKIWKWVIMPFYFLKTILLSKNFDIINFHFPNADLWLSSLFIKKEKLFITYHCDMIFENGVLNKFINFFSYLFMDLALKKSKYIIWNSKNYFQNSYFKKYSYKFIEILPVINFDNLENNKHKSINLNNNIIKKNDLVIWYLWRISKEKWIDLLIESSKNFKKTKILIWWNYKNIIWWSNIKKLENIKNKNCYFLWEVTNEQKKDFFSKIDVLVLPSINSLESFWIVQIESLYFNKPIIVSNMAWVNFLVNETWFWYTFETWDKNDLIKKINLFRKNIEFFKNHEKNLILNKKILEIYDKNSPLNNYIKIFN